MSNNYIEFLKYKQLQFQKLSVITVNVYRDFEGNRIGNNGLIILLKSLGKEISLDKIIDSVITITLSDDLIKPFITNYKDINLFVILTVCINKAILTLASDLQCDMVDEEGT